jgi:hypothetical protein
LSDKFEFIDAEYADSSAGKNKNAPSIVKMCRWLGVKRSSFNDWRSRPASATAKRRDELKLLIARSFTESDGTYGYRRVHADLVAWGVPCGLELVRRLMRDLGLEPCQPRPWRHCLTEQDGDAGPIPDLVGRDFTADTPGSKMVGDVTYIPTWEGWVYLATVIDCRTKAVVGWAMGDNYKTPLIEAAIEMAARNHDLADGAIFHSDRGSNYTSAQFAATLKNNNLRQSAGPASATTMPWPNRSSEPSKTSALTAPSIRPANTHTGILPATSNCATIPNAATRGSVTGPRSKSTMSTGKSSSQRELTVNTLSGKRVAPHSAARSPAVPNAVTTSAPAVGGAICSPLIPSWARDLSPTMPGILGRRDQG